MDKNPISSPAEAVAAALDWWEGAGVDSDFTNDPVNWLAKPEAPGTGPVVAQAERVPPPVPVIPPIGADKARWPKELADFASWWTALPDLPGSGPALAPRGAAGAELMILVTMPEAEDREHLLSGRQGELVGNMLRAMGIAPEKAFIAAALPRHAGHPDWAGLAERKLGDVLLHLVDLARPQRLLLLGREMLPLFGHDPAQPTANSPQIELQGNRTPTMASYGVETLLDQPRFRKALWQGWLEWTEGCQ